MVVQWSDLETRGTYIKTLQHQTLTALLSLISFKCMYELGRSLTNSLLPLMFSSLHLLPQVSMPSCVSTTVNFYATIYSYEALREMLSIVASIECIIENKQS